jgi:hypothetical protein
MVEISAICSCNQQNKLHKMANLQKRKRRILDRNKTTTVEWVAKKFSVSTAYVYAALRGDRTDGITAEIIAAFNKKYSQLQKALEV